jgi:CHAD domain-containing protein
MDFCVLLDENNRTSPDETAGMISKLARIGKWLPEVDPGQPLGEVARLAIGLRLRLVWDYVPLAAEHAEEDIEHVHQLRVASRRAVAALTLFNDLLPKKRRKRMRQQLNGIRQAAGKARDLDVFIGRLSGKDSPLSELAGPRVLQRLVAQREDAQIPLSEMYARLKDEEFFEEVVELPDKVRWRDSKKEQSFEAAARKMLKPAFRGFRDAATGDLRAIEALHKFRIQGKRLRYAMELLAGAFDPEFKNQLYPDLGKLQDRLGNLNDHATACERVSQWIEQLQPNNGDTVTKELKQLREKESRLVDTSADRFRSWWTDGKCAGFLRRLEPYTK